MRVSVHTEYTRRPPGRTACAARDEQRPLQLGEVGRVARLHPPARVRAAAQHTQSRARRVEQHAIEARVGHGQLPAIGDRRNDRADAATSRRPHHGAHACGMHVGREHHAVVAHALGRGGGLAARCRCDVENAFARLRIERGHDRLARLVLRRDATGAHRVERAEIAGVTHEERGGVETPGLDVDAERAQLVGHGLDRSAQRVDSERHDRRLVVERECGERIVAREIFDELLHDPIGMRRADPDR